MKNSEKGLMTGIIGILLSTFINAEEGHDQSINMSSLALPGIEV